MRKITFLITMLISGFASFAQFPAPYCGPVTFTSGVEPITLVNFAGINNTSIPTIAPGTDPSAHEDYTVITGNVSAGGTYPITLKGNSDGNYINYYRVYIDWNQNNDFTDAGESYDIGTITNSTGVDATQLTGSIVVPPTALAGTTRMRVMKRYNAYSTGPCQAGSGYGQAEDYSLTVTIPSCFSPVSLGATVLSSTSANLTWAAGGTETLWNVQWGVTGFALGTGTVANGVTSPYSLTTLAPATVYQFYVQANCGGGSLSSWSGPYAFDTTQTPECSTVISPADGATNVATGLVTFSWNAPATGDPATSYNMYYGTTPGNVTTPVGSFTTTTADINLSGFNTTYYWTIAPVNSGGEATGCAVWSFTTESAPGYCLAADNFGQYPSAPYTPATCDGVTANNIVTDGWAGEYSVVNVTSGETYRFQSSVATDLVTISADNGLTAAAYGTTPVTWTSTVTGPVRFYTHVDDQCTEEAVNRIRAVLCGASLSATSFDAASLKVYPNPVKNVLNLAYTTEISSVAVYNMLGQQVLSKTLNAAQSQLDMSNLSIGAYIVKVNCDGLNKTIKVVKE